LFEESKEGLTRVTKIIQNLRDFSRIDQAEAFDEYDINQGIEVTLTVARNAIKYHADVVTEFADVPHIPCNASQINQVFLNILVNAAQAIESQRRETNGSIRIRTYSDDTHVICKIIDDGPGIPADIIEKVFDPFFTTKPAGKGTGLGLSVSYDIIVRKHKGELLVSSVGGKGTEFTIKLPIKPAPIAEKHDKETEAGATIESSVC
jgi:signal transduction histidine kinase